MTDVRHQFAPVAAKHETLIFTISKDRVWVGKALIRTSRGNIPYVKDKVRLNTFRDGRLVSTVFVEIQRVGQLIVGPGNRNRYREVHFSGWLASLRYS